MFDRNGNTRKNIGKKIGFSGLILVMEPISITSKEFKLEIWGQNRGNKFQKNLFPENFYP